MTITSEKTRTMVDRGDRNDQLDQTIHLSPGSRLNYFFAWDGINADRRLVFDLSDGSEVFVGGYFIGLGLSKQTIDLRIIHSGRGAQSRTNLRGVLFDEAKADFRGLISIPKAGQQANAWLEERVLVLSNQAKSESLPSLEIEADDVRAGHAATTGQLNDTELFYLMARGLPKPEAASILIEGHLAAPFGPFRDPESQEIVRALLKTVRTLPQISSDKN